MIRNRISEKKLFVMLSTELFAMTSLILPAVLVGFAGTNGLPMLLSASGLLLLTAVWYMNCLNPVSQSPEIMLEKQENLLLKRGIRAVYIFRYFIHGLFLMVIFVNLIREVLLPDYPPFWIMIPILLLTYLTAGKQLRVRGRILEVTFPCIFLPLILVLFLALFQLDYASLPEQLWIMEKSRSGYSFLYGIYGVFMFYQPIEFLLFLVPALSGKIISHRQKKGSYIITAACLFVILINVIMYLVTIGLFGTVRTGDRLWSALYIMQSVRLPGRFVERLDILFLVFWIFGAFALFSAYMYYGSRFAAGKERTNSGRWYSAAWLFGILILTLWIKDPKTMFEFFVPYKTWIDFPLSFLLPLFLYKKRNKKNLKQRGAAILMAVLCLFCLTGCQERTDIEDKNYVMTIGIERGEEKVFKIVYEIADLSSGEEGGRTSNYVVYEADSLKEAEEMDKTREDKKLDFGHLKAFLISKKLMEDVETGKKLLSELEKNRSIAGTTLIFFTEEEIDKLLELGEEKGTSFGEYVDRLAANQKRKNSDQDTLAKWLKDAAEKKEVRSIQVLKTEGAQIVFQKGTLSAMAEATEVNGDMVRFHIRAASDSSFDQSKKIAVKDRILPSIQELLKNAESKEQCLEVLSGSLELIHQWVQKACEEENYSCESQVYLCRESFPLKAYGNVIVPSGSYDALRIDLGKAEGANWWCMMYPSLCMMEDVMGKETENKQKETAEAVKEETEETGTGIFLIKKKPGYQVRFKIAEWFSQIWSR